jgi:hypothetical protein
VEFHPEVRERLTKIRLIEAGSPLILPDYSRTVLDAQSPEILIPVKQVEARIEILKQLKREVEAV